MEKLKINQVRKQFKFSINKNTSCFDFLMNERHKYELDFDVYLPTKGINLQRELCWTLHQKQQFVLSILKGNSIPKITIIQYKDERVNSTVYKVIDGKQRLNTYIEFYNNEFSIIVDEVEYSYLLA